MTLPNSVIPLCFCLISALNTTASAQPAQGDTTMSDYYDIQDGSVDPTSISDEYAYYSFFNMLLEMNKKSLNPGRLLQEMFALSEADAHELFANIQSMMESYRAEVRSIGLDLDRLCANNREYLLSEKANILRELSQAKSRERNYIEELIRSLLMSIEDKMALEKMHSYVTRSKNNIRRMDVNYEKLLGSEDTSLSLFVSKVCKDSE